MTQYSDASISRLGAESSVVRVVERLGDAVIVSATARATATEAKRKPALVLMMNTKAGWRIRNFLGSAAVRP